MKKLIIPMLMLCIGHVGMMRAADTDVSAIDNVVYIESFQANPGTTALELSIKMKNTAAIRGFQFDLVLPEGVTPVEDDGQYVYWLNADRAPKKAGGQLYHTLEVTQQDDGSYRFLSGAQQDKTFIGNDGEVAVIQVNIAAGMAAGEYPITMKYVKLTETDISIYYLTEEVVSTLTVTETGDGRIVLDETSTTAPVASDGAVDVRVKRTINANEWSTICLPFDMTTEQINTAFPDMTVELADADSYETIEDDEENIVGINIMFNNVEPLAIVANHPYLIRVSSPVTNFEVDGVDVNPATQERNRRVSMGNRSYFIGNYKNETKVPEFCLFLSGNKFWYSIGETKIKAFRGYFNLNDVLTDVEEAKSRVAFSFKNSDGTTTGIAEMEDGKLKIEDSVYDLQGRRLKSQISNLKPQIIIVNGKKVVIK